DHVVLAVDHAHPVPFGPDRLGRLLGREELEIEREQAADRLALLVDELAGVDELIARAIGFFVGGFVVGARNAGKCQPEQEYERHSDAGSHDTSNEGVSVGCVIRHSRSPTKCPSRQSPDRFARHQERYTERSFAARPSSEVCADQPRTSATPLVMTFFPSWLVTSNPSVERSACVPCRHTVVVRVSPG